LPTVDHTRSRWIAGSTEIRPGRSIVILVGIVHDALVKLTVLSAWAYQG